MGPVMTEGGGRCLVSVPSAWDVGRYGEGEETDHVVFGDP